MIVLAKTGLRRLSTAPKQRSFMSSMTVSAPEEDCHFALILGKPGGGKGTISGKILKVCCGFFWKSRRTHSRPEGHSTPPRKDTFL